MTIYMDHQATTPTDKTVIEAMSPFWHTRFGNPHSAEHIVGWNANREIEDAKQLIAETLNCENDEICFYSGATEANNHAIFALSNFSKELPERKQVIISAIEHKCVIEATAFWAETYDLDVVILGVDEEGYVDLHELAKHLKVPTLFCSIMLVNNEVGTIQNIEKISEMLSEQGVYLHSDCAQSMKAVDSSSICDFVDIATFSGHKIGGPQGIGCAYISGELQSNFSALSFGGGQQNGLRSGTLPLPLVVGLSKAFELFSDEIEASLQRSILAKLRNEFWLDLKRKIPDAELNGPELDNRHPGNLNVCLPGVSSSDLLMTVQPNVCASSGSACSSGSVEPSYVISALHADFVRAQCSLRLSLDVNLTERELLSAADSISLAYQKLKDL